MHLSSGTVKIKLKLIQNLFTLQKGCQIILICQWSLKNKFWVNTFQEETFFRFFNFHTIVDKTNVTLLQSPLSPQSMLINERLRQREGECSAKAPTTRNLQHWNWGKGGQYQYASRYTTLESEVKIYGYVKHNDEKL